jgi:hypothetical protein
MPEPVMPILPTISVFTALVS